MSASALALATENTDKFYTIIKSIHAFDASEVQGVIDTLISPTPRDNCFVGTYYRTLPNVETLLLLNSVKYVQAISMLARALFELSIDGRLLEQSPDAALKMIGYADLEKLRAANKVVKFKKDNPDADIDVQVYESFITNNSERITRVRMALWPGVKRLSHWSGLSLEERVAQVKSPFDEVYARDYPRLSWYVHSGLTGVMKVAAETFIHLCASAYYIASIGYGETLLSVVRVFKIAKADEKIEVKLRVARMLPFTKTPEEAEALMSLVQ
jgi:Family of unknown function (DUF5677)